MTTPREIAREWRWAYARQAASDFAVHDYLALNKNLPTCHRLHYLQMAFEKTAKAHYWGTTPGGLDHSRMNKTHEVAQKFLPVVVRNYWMTRSRGQAPAEDFMDGIRLLCREIDLLAPAVSDDQQRKDNCEYPWELLDENGGVSGIRSPLDQSFAAEGLLKRRHGVTLLKAVKALLAEIDQNSA